MGSHLLQLKLFGRFEALYNGLPITSFATDKVRALLAFLSIESDKPHRRESLANLLWPNFTTDTARGNLRKSLYRLRQVLTNVDPNLPDQLLSQTRQTVTLHANAISVDALAFKELTQHVESSGEPLDRLNALRHLYEGEFLAGFSVSDAYAFEEWLTIQRELFHQTAISTIADLLALSEADRVEDDELLAAANHLLTLDPWHERTHRQIMRIHQQRGNRSGAVKQYHELRTMLLRELGVEPSPATTNLYEQIKAEVDTATPIRPASEKNRLEQFPSPLTPLIGRKAELDQLIQRLQDPACRLLTITGPGGIGKTRLSVETARRLAAIHGVFPDGILFISLAGIRERHRLISVLGQSLGLPSRLGTDLETGVLNYLRHKQMLLALDNFEQLLPSEQSESIPAAIVAIKNILASAPQITLMITSREPLVIQGEWVVTLDGLSFSDQSTLQEPDPLTQSAAQLFIECARRYRPEFDEREHRASIAEICRLTGGLPLALEIAAAWMRAYSPRDIALQIAHSLDFLTNPFRDAPARQKSIRAVFESAWQQLTTDEQNALAAMSIFQGEFTVPAALAVTETSVINLASLVVKSLLRRTNENRYGLHELVKTFAAEKLTHTYHARHIYARHATFYFSFLNEQIKDLNGRYPKRALAEIQQAIDNLRAAWEWSVAERHLDHLENGVLGLSQFFILTGNNAVGEEIFMAAAHEINHDTAEYTAESFQIWRVQSLLCAQMAWLQSGTAASQPANDNAVKAVEFANVAEDPFCRAQSLSILGWRQQIQGTYTASEASLNEALAIFNQIDRPLEASLALIRLGSIYWRKGLFEKALDYYQQSHDIEEQLQNKRGINRAAGGIGLVYVSLKKRDKALEWLNRALAIDRELDNRYGITRHLGNIGGLYSSLGNYTQALASYEEAAAIDRELENRSTLAIWLSSVGRVHLRSGNLDRALSYYDEAIPMSEELGNLYNLCESFLDKGEILLHLGDIEQAAELIQRGYQLAEDVHRPGIQFRGRLLQARLLAHTDKKTQAEEQLQQLLTTLDDPEKGEQAAQIFDELWQVTRAPSHAHLALNAYASAEADFPSARYRQRIIALESFLNLHQAND